MQCARRVFRNAGGRFVVIGWLYNRGPPLRTPKRLESRSLWAGDLKVESFILTRYQCQQKG